MAVFLVLNGAVLKTAGGGLSMKTSFLLKIGAVLYLLIGVLHTV